MPGTLLTVAVSQTAVEAARRIVLYTRTTTITFVKRKSKVEPPTKSSTHIEYIYLEEIHYCDPSWWWWSKKKV